MSTIPSPTIPTPPKPSPKLTLKNILFKSDAITAQPNNLTPAQVEMLAIRLRRDALGTPGNAGAIGHMGGLAEQYINFINAINATPGATPQQFLDAVDKDAKMHGRTAKVIIDSLNATQAYLQSLVTAGWLIVEQPIPPLLVPGASITYETGGGPIYVPPK